MIAKIATTFEYPIETIWDKITQTGSLEYISAPLLTFKPVDGNGLEDCWRVGHPYKLSLFFLNMLPLGNHQITIVKIDPKRHEIVSEEGGTLAKVWNHSIYMQAVGQESVYYTDKIEIKAGLLTLPVWLFANAFYRHRQRRWKKLLRSSRKSEK
jgi:hypothetical protein